MCSSFKTGKTRTREKYRVVYTDHQRLELEKEFHYNRYITIRRKSELAANLRLSERQVEYGSAIQAFLWISDCCWGDNCMVNTEMLMPPVPKHWAPFAVEPKAGLCNNPGNAHTIFFPFWETRVKPHHPNPAWISLWAVAAGRISCWTF